MKTLFTILFAVTVFTVSAQKDTAIIPKGAIPIYPTLFFSDSAYSISWVVNRITSDTTVDSYGEIHVFSKRGNQITEYGFPIPCAIINGWGTNNSSIDNFIFNKFPQFKKK